MWVRPMFSASVDLYDLFYASKDYRSEAARVAVIIRERNPEAISVLDVGCGTGEHARYLATDHGFEVDGIDVQPGFIRMAREKNQLGVFLCADMRNFRLNRSYDAIVCLFSSIGYVRDKKNLHSAVVAMAAHLTTRGVLIVEPWFEPGGMEHGYVTCMAVDAPGGKVCRMTHTTLERRLSRLQFEYLIGTPDGLRRESETHELGLFSREEMTAAFHEAGLLAEFESEGLIGRGLYVASSRT